MYVVQPPLLAFKDFLQSDSNDRLVLVLSALNVEPLLQRLGRRGRRGRRGHSLRVLLYAVIAGWVYDLHSMAELRRELLRNGSLRLLCGIQSVAQVPSEDAFSRFFAKLAQRVDAVETLYATTVAELRKLAPELGKQIAIDATAINAWAEGNRRWPADPDARWGCKGHKTKGKSPWWLGYKLHLAVDTEAELPLAYTVTPANVADSSEFSSLLSAVRGQQPKGHLEVAIADAGYDSKAVYEAVWELRALPVIDYNDRGWEPQAGYTEEGCPLCECGKPMRFLGRDRDYVKYGSGEGCSCREGKLIRRWRIDGDVRLHPPLPRHTKKWQRLYDKRTAVERVNSRGKEHVRLRTLRHRGIMKARLHCGLSLLVLVAGALGMMLSGRNEWARSVVQLVA